MADTYRTGTCLLTLAQETRDHAHEMKSPPAKKAYGGDRGIVRSARSPFPRASSTQREI
jgi:hypothetical protein